jgi:hypothetical protein
MRFKWARAVQQDVLREMPALKPQAQSPIYYSHLLERALEGWPLKLKIRREIISVGTFKNFNSG